MGNEDFFKWLDYGIDQGWISDVFCSTHDYRDHPDEEDIYDEDMFDRCVPVVRVWGKEVVFD